MFDRFLNMPLSLLSRVWEIVQLLFIKYHYFPDGGPYHIETILLICRANQWTGFSIIGTSIMKGLTFSDCQFETFCIFRSSLPELFC